MKEPHNPPNLCDKCGGYKIRPQGKPCKCPPKRNGLMACICPNCGVTLRAELVLSKSKIL